MSVASATAALRYAQTMGYWDLCSSCLLLHQNDGCLLNPAPRFLPPGWPRSWRLDTGTSLTSPLELTLWRSSQRHQLQGKEDVFSPYRSMEVGSAQINLTIVTPWFSAMWYVRWHFTLHVLIGCRRSPCSSCSPLAMQIDRFIFLPFLYFLPLTVKCA